MKGDKVSIEIPEDAFIAGVEDFKHVLHGRVILPKGLALLSADCLRNKQQILWKSLGKWGITLIGKGFYEFTFSSNEDQRRVRYVGSWALNTGLLHSLKISVLPCNIKQPLMYGFEFMVWHRNIGENVFSLPSLVELVPPYVLTLSPENLEWREHLVTTRVYWLIWI